MTARGDMLEPDWVQCNVVVGGKLDSMQFQYENSAFILELANGSAVFTFREPVGSMREAEMYIQEFTTSWVGAGVLQKSPARLELRVNACKAGRDRILAQVFGTARIIGSDEVERRRKPWKYHPFTGDELVAALVSRYEDYLRGRERLVVMG